MITNIILSILIAFALIRTTAYGIYCIKEKNILGSISIFFLDITVLGTTYILFFLERAL